MSESAWQELALEVLRVVGRQIAKADFDDYCHLARASAGRSYYDRMRVAEDLIAEGLLYRDSEFLRSNIRSIPSWLTEQLANGRPEAWVLIDHLDRGRGLVGKIEHEVLGKIGKGGEDFVVACLFEALPAVEHSKIVHVSEVDDGAGFDIATPSTLENSQLRLIEVKTSSRISEDFHFFISRNEMRVARQNKDWYLVGVSRVASHFEILGHLPSAVIDPVLPADTSPWGRWETARVALPRRLFLDGLP